jgi:hypothetical protein
MSPANREIAGVLTATLPENFMRRKPNDSRQAARGRVIPNAL